jgi:hypothetical protein
MSFAFVMRSSLRPRSDGTLIDSVTADFYGHLVPGGNRDAVDLLDDERPRVAKTLQTRGLTLVKRSEESSNLLEKRGEPGGNRTRKAKPKAET